jgi:cytochrome c oxidase cbb3-type subunit 3
MTNDKEMNENGQSVNQDNSHENLTDHNYDGITELDNPPPTWIMAIFFITILFSLLYGAHYFWFNQGENQDQEYITTAAEHDSLYKSMQDKNFKPEIVKDEALLAEGAQIFKQMNCFACHGNNGEGNAVGPNLTDNFWLNGCDVKSVFNTIKNGKAAKGMAPFKSQLSDAKILNVSSYILVKLKDSNPANAKSPQGEECK